LLRGTKGGPGTDRAQWWFGGKAARSRRRVEFTATTGGMHPCPPWLRHCIHLLCIVI